MTSAQTVGEPPLVSVVIPAKNEAGAIGAAIESVKRQLYPLERVELIVVDGGSTDATAAVSREHASGSVFASFEVISNPVGTTPSNLNAGLERAKGDIVVRVDARSRLPQNYLARCVELLDGNVAVVGGRQVAVSNGSSAIARGIARSLNNRFAMGGAAYRSAGSASGPVDTVYLGAFRRQDLNEVGGWSTAMGSNQDYELNQRISRVLNKPVWFASDLEVRYIARATLAEIGQQYHRFGRWKVRYWRQNGQQPQPRQVVLLVAPPAAAVIGVSLAIVLPNRRLVPLAAAALGSLFVADEVGSVGPDGGPFVRATAITSMALVGISWWTGVAREFVSGEPR